MKNKKHRLLSFMMISILVFSLFPALPAHALAESISYPAAGGRIRYHTKTNFVVNCEPDVTSVYIPRYLNVRDANGSYSLEVKGISKEAQSPLGAFAEKASLTSVALEEGIASIAPQTFAGSKKLAGVTLPGSVKEISPSAFQGCTGLREITVQDGIQTIGVNAFQGCYNLERAYFFSRDCSISPTAFSGVKKEAFQIYCYQGSTAEKFAVENNIPYTLITGSDDRFTVDSGGILTEVHGGESVIEIPAQIGGVPVTGIAPRLFEDSKAVQKIVLPDSITTIGDSAFSGCTELKELNLPGSLTSIGSRAFLGCQYLSDLTLPEGLTGIGALAFSGCTGLTEIRVPRAVQEVGMGAFSGCGNLAQVILEDGIMESGQLVGGVPLISNGMFNGCAKLKELLVPNSVKEIQSNAFAGCNALIKLTIPNAQTDIENSSVFSNLNKKLTIYCAENSPAYFTAGLADPPVQTVLIAGAKEQDYTVDPSTGLLTGYTGAGGNIILPRMVKGTPVTGVAPGAFQNNSTITEVLFQDHIKSIGESAFENCTELLRLTWSEHLPAIPEGAFAGCTNLIYIYLPETLTTIGARAFEGCARLPEVKLPGSLREIGNRAFAMKAPEGETVVTSLAGIDLPESLTKIGDYAFENCKMFTKITVPASVSYLGTGAFQGCSRLAAAVLNNPLDRIPDALFKDCTDLNNLTLPDGIKEIGDRAFYHCSALSAFSFSPELQRIGDEAFYRCTALDIGKIPAGLTSLGSGAFARSGIGTVELPEGLSVIPERAFAECQNLILTIPGMYTSVASTAFENAKTTVKCYRDSQTWDDLSTLGDTIALVALDPPEIPEEGFYANLDGLILGYTGPLGETLEIPQRIGDTDVTGVAAYAFANQTGITELILPEGVEIIGSNAFSGCTGLSRLTLPESLTTIGAEAFANCALGRLELKNHIAQIGRDAFRDCADLVILCSAGSAAFGYARSSAVRYEAEIVTLDVTVSEDQNTYTVTNTFADKEIILVFGAYTANGDLLEYQYGKVGSYKGLSCTFNPYNLRVADQVKVFAWDRLDTIRPVSTMFVSNLGTAVEEK